MLGVAKKYFSTKTYTHETGLTATFRQHRAHSHCRFLHGYALQIKFVFGATELDHNGWVVDFGGLKDLRGWLEGMFDHKTLVADSDPLLHLYQQMADAGLIQLRVVPATGCEAFAAMILEYTDMWLTDAGFAPRCKIVSVEVSEHGGNSAIVVNANCV